LRALKAAAAKHVYYFANGIKVVWFVLDPAIKDPDKAATSVRFIKRYLSFTDSPGQNSPGRRMIRHLQSRNDESRTIP